MPISEWTEDQLAELIGRREGQFLEAKGPEIDLSRSQDRRKLARVVAGFASTTGGILVIGASESADIIDALPGVIDPGDAEAKVRNALRDLVTPLPHLQTKSFTVPPDRSVIVVEVLPDPAGRPIMVHRDGFWIRADDSTVTMPYPDIELRMRHAADGLERASARASELLARIRPSHSPVEEIPMGMAIMPIATSTDLGRTGWAMQQVWWDVANSALAAWESVDPGLARRLKPLPEPTVTGHGLHGENDSFRFEVDFQGGAVAALPLQDLLSRKPTPYPDAYKSSVALAHLLGVILAVQRQLGAVGPVLLSFVSGHRTGPGGATAFDTSVADPIPAAPFTSHTERRSVQFESPINIWGATANGATAALKTFLTRLTDHGSTYTQRPPVLQEEGKFLTSMLP